MVLLWAIWKARNELIWKQKSLFVEEIKVLANVTLTQGRKAQNSENLLFFELNTNTDDAEIWNNQLQTRLKSMLMLPYLREAGVRKLKFGAYI